MSDTQNMSIKAYLTRSDGGEEVRRFGVPEETSTSYSYLKERIRTIFGLAPDNFQIHWQDSENDYVLISSDEELFEAITECITRQEQNLLRIYVTEHKFENKSETPRSDNAEKSKNANANNDKFSKGGIPVRVICDGCDERLVGIRFKCKTCPDYDLCESCEAKGYHKHHQFHKLPKEFGRFEINVNTDIEGTPEEFRFPGWRRCGRGRGGRAFRRWAHQQHFHHHHQQQQQQQQQQQSQQQEQKQNQQQQQQQQQQQSFGGMPNFCQSENNNSGSERPPPNPFQFSFSNSSSGGGGCPFVSVGGGIFPPPGADGINITIPEMNFAAPNMGFPDPQKVAEEAGRFASQMASKQVAEIMKGIWSAWSGNQERNGNANDQQENAQDDQNSKGPSDKCSDKCSCAPGVIDLELDDDITPTPKEKETNASGEKQAEEMETGGPDVVVMETEESGPTPSGKSSPVQGDDWTLLNKESSPDGGSKTPSAPPAPSAPTTGEKEKTGKSGYPSIPTEEVSSPPHPNVKVRNALVQMRAMGYSDEGGWLTKLLEMKDGDINKVLDILLVQKK